jgi:hypothetical protein
VLPLAFHLVGRSVVEGRPESFPRDNLLATSKFLNNPRLGDRHQVNARVVTSGQVQDMDAQIKETEKAEVQESHRKGLGRYKRSVELCVLCGAKLAPLPGATLSGE